MLGAAFKGVPASARSASQGGVGALTKSTPYQPALTGGFFHALTPRAKSHCCPVDAKQFRTSVYRPESLGDVRRGACTQASSENAALADSAASGHKSRTRGRM